MSRRFVRDDPHLGADHHGHGDPVLRLAEHRPGTEPMTGRRGIIVAMPERDTTRQGEHRLDETLDFMRLLWSIEHGLQKHSKRMEAEIGLTGPQRLVLRIVGEFPGLSAGDLARVVKLHPSTITGILQRLVKRRLLRRERDPDDSRRVRLWAAPAAKRYTRRSGGTVEDTVRKALAAVGHRNVRGARTVLTELARAFSQ